MTNAAGRGRAIPVLLLIASVGYWLVPSDVVELIVRQRHVLLGRYSVERLTSLMLVTPLLCLFAYLIHTAGGKGVRQAVFKGVTLVFCVLSTIIAGNAVARLVIRPRYIEQDVGKLLAAAPPDASAAGVKVRVRLRGKIRTRPPNSRSDHREVDAPAPVRSYPGRPPGFPPQDISFSTDARGFRNARALEQADVVVLGDSFAAGDHVSDDESWCALLQKRWRTPVYNLAVSGLNPHDYLNALLAYGLALKPKLVLVMIYEGNDFKDYGPPIEVAAPEQASFFFGLRNGPLASRLKGLMIARLGPLRAHCQVPGWSNLSWMPIALTNEAGTQYYSFLPKRLLRLHLTESEFRGSPSWRHKRRLFEEMQYVAQQVGIRLVLVYAPSKPHVLMPIVRDRIPAAGLHRFASFRRRKLPPPEEFKGAVYLNLGALERVFSAFCDEARIECISTTESLRAHALTGKQVYYTYDQHWTKLGHIAAADALARHLEADDGDFEFSAQR